jgi:hypothetical protein
MNKKRRALVAKEVGMGNPAEKTTRGPTFERVSATIRNDKTFFHAD